ncbi:hypothetical protein KR018_005625, partial [Drosophila ironensis]
MPIVRKFFCFSLREAALFFGYLGLLVECLHIAWSLTFGYSFCSKVIMLWSFATLWNLCAELFLLTAVYRQNVHLLPAHMVTYLCGLILELMSHMLTAASGSLCSQTVGYAVFSISCKLVIDYNMLKI